MKRYLATILAALFLLTTVDALARPLLVGQKVVYRGTVTGLRISSVSGGSTESGGAFIDGANASITALADGNHIIEIYDASNRMIKGVLKAAGAAETLDSELLPNPSFDVNTTGWIPAKCTIASTAGGQSNNCCTLTQTDTYPNFQTAAEISQVVGALYKASGYFKSGTSGNLTYILRAFNYPAESSVISITGTTSGSWVQNSGYGTALQNLFDLRATKQAEIDGTMLFDEFSYKKVLTPSTSGATIQDGSGLWNWASKNASFDYVGAQTSCTVIVKLMR